MLLSLALLAILCVIFFILIKSFDLSKKNIQIAYIQGSCTILTGLFALGAALSAYVLATRETRRHEEQQRAKCKAYRYKMLVVLGNLSQNIRLFLSHNSNRPFDMTRIFPFDIRPENWSNNALLTENEIASIYDVYCCLEGVHVLFCKEDPHEFESIKTRLTECQNLFLLPLISRLSTNLNDGKKECFSFLKSRKNRIF